MNHNISSGKELDDLAALYGLKRAQAEPDHTFRRRLLELVVPPKPASLDEHLDRMERLHRFFHTP